MNACSLIGFDLLGCIGGAIGNVLFFWVPLVPWWGWVIAGLVVIGLVWKFAGWPGLIGLGVLAGFFLGRRSAVENDEIWPDPDPKPQRRRSSQKPPPGKRVRTIFDMLRKRG